MTAPGQTRSQTLSELRAIRKDMSSAIFIRSVGKKPEKVQRDAAIKLFQTVQAIRTLENTKLADIRDNLIANEQELVDGITALGRARKRLTQVEKILDAVGDVIDVVAKVVKITGLI